MKVSQNGKVTVSRQKVFLRVNLDSMDVIIGKEDILIAALVSLSKIEAKVWQSSQISDSQKLLRRKFLIHYHQPWPSGADPGEVKRVNFHPPFSEPPSC